MLINSLLTSQKQSIHFSIKQVKKRHTTKFTEASNKQLERRKNLVN